MVEIPEHKTINTNPSSAEAAQAQDSLRRSGLNISAEQGGLAMNTGKTELSALEAEVAEEYQKRKEPTFRGAEPSDKKVIDLWGQILKDKTGNMNLVRSYINNEANSAKQKYNGQGGLGGQPFQRIEDNLFDLAKRDPKDLLLIPMMLVKSDAKYRQKIQPANQYILMNMGSVFCLL